MGYATDGQLPRDINGNPAEGVYTANVGTVAAKGGPVTVDAFGAPLAASAVIGDKAANTLTTLTDTPLVTALAPSNTGLPVNLPSIVQKANAVSTGSVASLAKAFTGNNVAGNSIVVVCGCGNGTAMTVADSAGNTYMQAQNAPNSTTFESAIFYTTNIIAGANTVTVTNAGTAASMGMQIYEVSGIIAEVGPVLGQTSSGTGTGATASGSNIAGQPNSLAFAGVAVGIAAQAVSAATGTNWTLDSTQNSAGTPAGLFTFGALSLQLGNIAPVAAKATIASSEPWAYAVAVFKPVAVGIEGSVTIGGYNKTYITTGTTTLVKTGSGVLRSIIVNKLVASATIELDDAVTNTNAFGIITLPGTITALAPFAVPYDTPFTTGLSITTSGATDVTVVWR